jgi:diguanylate cyclase (GGDEF)-like protein
VYNRRFFDEELVRLDVCDNIPLSFLYIDVNGLKTVNDAFGHQVGDEFIMRISGIIKSVTRSCDIIARIGGDEFVVVLPETILSAAEQIAMLIKDHVSRIRVMDIEISISVGWDTKSSLDMDLYDVLKRAEDLMYSKKIFNSTTKMNGIIRSILNSLLIKNPRENAHSKRVSEICAKIGEAYHLSDDEIKELKTIGELHDIGKIAIDEAILNKEGSLSESEWAQIKKHPETGYRLLGTSNEFINLSEYILAHHERWDGRGYPRGLSAEEIPWKARIIAVADSYDAMTCDRPYRKALSKEEAIAQLKINSGTQFDPEIVTVFINSVSNLL